MKRYVILLFLVATSLIACANSTKDSENRTKIRLATNKGDIVIALYNETPLHRDNFVKLTRQKFFNGTLFHRVIDNFMIQGGDPDSKYAKPGAALGNGGPGYRIPAEIVSGIFHKKGVIAAARMGDKENPARASSGSQFYLTEGKVFTIAQLNNMEKAKNADLRKELITIFKEDNKAKIDSLIILQKKTRDTIALKSFVAELNLKIDSIVAQEGFHFTAEQKEAYTTVGGVPHLDGAYTVFGEVIAGQNVIDEIAEVETDKRNRPVQDVIIRKATVVESK